MQYKQLLLVAVTAILIAYAHAAYPADNWNQANINRQSTSQSGGAASGLAGLTQSFSGIMNSVVSSIPSMLTNAVPVLLLLGLGGLLLPLLGVSLFFREGQKRTFSLPSINPAILDGLADVLDRVTKAIEQGEKKYGGRNN